MNFQIQRRCADEWRLIADGNCMAKVYRTRTPEGEVFDAVDFYDIPIGDTQPTDKLAMDLARNRFNQV